MIPILALAMIVPQGSLFDRVVPKATGSNGYEEYVRAAEIVSSPAGRAFATFEGATKAPEGASPETAALYRRLSEAAPLEVAREALGKYGAVLSLVRQGNRKTVAHPRGTILPETPLPEFASFRTVGRLHAVAAKAQAADGRTDAAVETLFEGLTMADNVGRFLLIGNLVSVSTSGYVFRGFADMMPRLSRRDAVSVQQRAASLLARPPSLLGALRSETAMTAAAVEAFLRGEPKIAALDSSYPKNGDLRRIESMGLGERSEFLKRVLGDLRERQAAMERVLKGPESLWAKGFEAMDVETDSKGASLSEELIHRLVPQYGTAVAAAVRSRTQMRLLALHARLIQYRWDHGRWPEAVDEVDPLSGSRYVYEILSGGTIRLASRGVPETGEIELKYRGAPRFEKGEP